MNAAAKTLAAAEVIQGCKQVGNAISPCQFAALMQAIADRQGDVELDHKRADDLLCKVLTSLGYGAGVTVYEEEIQKWYA